MPGIKSAVAAPGSTLTCTNQTPLSVSCCCNSATATPQGIAPMLRRIEAFCGYPVLDFPKQDEYRVELKFRV